MHPTLARKVPARSDMGVSGGPRTRTHQQRLLAAANTTVLVRIFDCESKQVVHALVTGWHVDGRQAVALHFALLLPRVVTDRKTGAANRDRAELCNTFVSCVMLVCLTAVAAAVLVDCY